MSELDDLYQTLILEHNRSPRNFREIANASGHEEGRNPLCGDAFDVWVSIKDGIVADASFKGQGCAISKASASMMTTAIRGKSVAEARRLFEQFREVVTGRRAVTDRDRAEAREVVGCLSAFAGVSAFPIRVKCATLAWHAMIAAVEAGARGEDQAHERSGTEGEDHGHAVR
jgi:nitrogen fixation NifU-like protein